MARRNWSAGLNFPLFAKVPSFCCFYGGVQICRLGRNSDVDAMMMEATPPKLGSRTAEDVKFAVENFDFVDFLMGL